MTHQLTRTLLLTLTAFSLAACGGGGGGGGDTSGGTPPGGGGTPPPTVEPISSAGFASDTTDFSDGGTSFETQSDNIIWVSNNGTVVEQDETIQLDFNDDLSRVTITRSNDFGGGRIGRFSIQLDRATNTDNYTGNTLVLLVEETADNQNARLARVGDIPNFITGHTNFLVYGFDTDPAEMPTSGSADFTGNVRAAYAPNPQVTAGTADGTFTLTADFGGDVSGQMSIDALNAGSAGQGSTDWTMNDATITGNGFSGTLTNATSDPVDGDTTVNAANYDGRFYGTDADAVGGHFLIELTDDGEDAYIYGAFLGDED